MSNLAKSIVLPDLRAVLETNKDNIFDKLNCHLIGIVDSFDITNQTAEIKIVFKKTFENVEYEYPMLVDCPVFVFGGSDSSLRFPVKQGDTCLVLFNDVNIDDWFEGSTNKIPESNRKHDLSDGIALIGLRNLQNSISDYDNDAVQLNNDDTKIVLKEKINLSNSTSDIKTLLDNLIDAVKAITTFGSPTNHAVTATSQTALEAIKTQIGTVFE